MSVDEAIHLRFVEGEFGPGRRNNTEPGSFRLAPAFPDTVAAGGVANIGSVSWFIVSVPDDL
jgi:hypothetical protein